MSKFFSRGYTPVLLTFFLFWFAAITLSQCIPPVQSPDETGHITRAYMISRGAFSMDRAPPGSPEEWGGSGGQIDKSLGFFIDSLADVRSHDDSRSVQHDRIDKFSRLHWTFEERFYPSPGTNYYFPAIYAPHAMGFWFARSLDLSMNHSYLLVRMMVITNILVIFFLAWALHKPNPLVVGLIFMPMTAFQLISPTIDGMATALAVLVMSIFLSMLPGGGAHQKKLIGCLYICLFILINSRVYLFPMVLIPMYLAWVNRSARQGWWSCLLVLACIGWLMFGLASTIDDRVVRQFSSSQIALSYMKNPVELISLIWRTVADAERFELYATSFVGVFGWMDLPIPRKGFMMVLIGLFALTIVAVSKLWSEQQKKALSWTERLLLIFIGSACAFSAFAALAVTWSPYPADAIAGLQGRYFIVPAIIAVTALSSHEDSGGGNNRWKQFSIQGVSIFYIIGAIGILIMTHARKYDFVPLW